MSTVTEPYTFQLGDNGIVLGSDIVPGVPFIDIAQVQGFDSAPFRETKRDHEGVDGGFMDAEFEQGRDIVIDGTLYSNGTASLEPFLDTLKQNYAPSQTLVPFYMVTDASEVRFLNVKPLGVHYNWDNLRRLGMSSVQFILYAEDPRIYGMGQNSIILPIGATFFSGFGFPLGFSFGFGGISSTSDGVQVGNNGNRNAPLILTITGPVTDPQIVHDETGQVMQITGEVPVGHTLVLNTLHHTVRLDGTANRRSMLTIPGWFELLPGNNTVRFRATGGSGTLTIQYMSAWR